MLKRRSKTRKTSRKSTKSQTTARSSVEPEQCVVCLDTIYSRGLLPVCDHAFCYSCIFEWSKNTNTCPLCKERFRCITKISPQTPPRKVRVTDKDQSEHIDEGVSLMIPDEYEETGSLNGFIVSDDTYTPDDSTFQLEEEEEVGGADHTPFQSTPSHPPPTTAGSSSFSLFSSPWQPAPSLNESSDNEEVLHQPLNRTRKRCLLSSFVNEIQSSSTTCTSPWQPLLRNRTGRRCIQDSSSEEDTPTLVTNSGWLSSRQQRNCNKQVTTTHVVKKKVKRKRISFDKNRAIHDDSSSDSDWSPSISNKQFNCYQ